MLIDENEKEVKSPTQILDDLSKIKLDSQKEKEENLNKLHDSIDKIEADRKAKENDNANANNLTTDNDTTENIKSKTISTIGSLILDKSNISPVVEPENDHTETTNTPTIKIKNSNDSVSFKDITDKAKSLKDIVNNAKHVEVPHINIPEEYRSANKPNEYKDTHTSDNTDKNISVISFKDKSDNNKYLDIHDKSYTSNIIDDYVNDISNVKKDLSDIRNEHIKNISDIKNDCKTFESDIKELFIACDKLHVTDSRIKTVLNKLRSNTNNIMTILFVDIIVTVILAIVAIFLIISNINIKSEIKYIEENTTRDSISSATSYYNEDYNTGSTSNSSSSITMQNDDIQDKYPNGIPTNTNDNSENSSSVSKTESSTDTKDTEDESTSSLEDSEDVTENTDDTDGVALIENEHMYYNILNTTTEKIVGTFENRVLTNMTSGDVSYSLDIVSSDGTVYELKSGIIDRNDLDNNYASVKKEARQYDIISSIDDALIDSDYLCEITLSKCECSDNKVRYMIDTYKGTGKKNN